MSVFIPGQRWISESEPELGLGTVVPAFIDDDIQLLEFSAVEAFFEIDHWDAKALFLNTRYPEADVTAADVAARVRELLETGDLSNHLERDDPDDDEPDDDEPYDSDDDDDADADDADDEQEADIS